MIKNFLTIQICYLINDKNLIPFKQLCHTINKKIELESKCIFNQFSCVKINPMVYEISCIQGFTSTDGYFYHIFNTKNEYKRILEFATLTYKKFYGLKRHIKYIENKYTQQDFLTKFEINRTELENYSFFDII